MSDEPVTVEITDVVPQAERIRATDLKVGDKLFDTFGGTHEIVSTRVTRHDYFYTMRDDGVEDRWHGANIVTAIRGGTS